MRRTFRVLPKSDGTGFEKLSHVKGCALKDSKKGNVKISVVLNGDFESWYSNEYSHYNESHPPSGWYFFVPFAEKVCHFLKLYNG